jgi:enamine deaminase RidA (YjgF/YER057c/UK114 family)
MNPFAKLLAVPAHPLADSPCVSFRSRIAAKIGTSPARRNRDPRCGRLARPVLIGQEGRLNLPAETNHLEDAMAGAVESKLNALGITLKEPAKPIANYVAYVRTGNLLTVSGQLCFGGDGKLVATGQLGAGVSVEDGQRAARACAISLITQVKAALGDLDKVKQVVRLGGFINSAPGFTDGPKVMNGASDLMVEVFGDKGKHARSTVGVSALPADAAVEVEGTFEVF